MKGLNLWRCMAIVSASMIDIAYARSTPEPPSDLTPETFAGYYGTLAMELIYTPAWA